MAGFAAQAALRDHWVDLVDTGEVDVSQSLKSAVGWLKQVGDELMIIALLRCFLLFRYSLATSDWL